MKYKQAILGFAWAIFVPVISVMLFTAIGHAAGFTDKVPTAVTLSDGQLMRGVVTDKLDSLSIKPDRGPAVEVPRSAVISRQSIPYPVFVFAGLLPWLFLQASINNGGMSLISQQNLLSKIYLPRLYMPTAVVGNALIDMGLSTVVLCGAMAIYRFAPPIAHLMFLPLFLLLAIITALGFSYLLSALTVNFRDVRFLIGFFSQILMWISAAVYPARIFGEHEKWLAINPLYGIIGAFKWALIGRGMPLNAWALSISIIEGFALFVFGIFYFRRAERRFADIA